MTDARRVELYNICEGSRAIANGFLVRVVRGGRTTFVRFERDEASARMFAALGDCRAWRDGQWTLPRQCINPATAAVRGRFLCDDLLRMPGHPDWRPMEPRRRILANRCPELGRWLERFSWESRPWSECYALPVCR